MQNDYRSRLGQTLLGVYSAKFTSYQGPSDSHSTKVTKLPWNGERGIETLQDLVLVLGKGYKIFAVY